MKNFRKTISITGYIVMICWLIWAINYTSREERLCGYIKYKVDATTFSKYSAHADPIFVIQLDRGDVEEVHPTWNDYLSKKVNDRVCYTFRIPTSVWHFVMPWMGILIWIILGFWIWPWSDNNKLL